MKWQWQCIQYRLTVTTYYNMEWQWLLQHGVTVTVTTWSDSDYMLSAATTTMAYASQAYNRDLAIKLPILLGCKNSTTTCFTAWCQMPQLHSLKTPTSRSSSISTKSESKTTRITTKRWNQILWRATCMRPRQLQGQDRQTTVVAHTQGWSEGHSTLWLP